MIHYNRAQADVRWAVRHVQDINSRYRPFDLRHVWIKYCGIQSDATGHPIYRIWNIYYNRDPRSLNSTSISTPIKRGEDD